MAEILNFPGPKPREVVLVDNIDVAFCLLAINMYGIPNDEDIREGYGLVGPEDLPTLNAEFVRECLEEAKSSEELSDKGKAIIVRLLSNNQAIAASISALISAYECELHDMHNIKVGAASGPATYFPWK